MPPKNKPVGQTRKKQPECECPSTEQIERTIVEKMNEHFEEKFDKLKNNLITLMAEKLATLIEENNSLKSTLEDEVEDLREWQKDINKKVQDITLNQTKQTCGNSCSEVKDVQEQMYKFQSALDDSEQMLKERNVRIVGLPEQDDEHGKLKQRIVEVSKTLLNIGNISTTDIDEAYRLGKQKENEARTIMVRFKAKSTRDSFYRSRRNLYENSTNHNSSGIYLNKDLTPYRQKLYFDVRQLRRRGEIHSVWTQEGTIVLKLQEADQPKTIKTHRELVELLRVKADSNE